MDATHVTGRRVVAYLLDVALVVVAFGVGMALLATNMDPQHAEAAVQGSSVHLEVAAVTHSYVVTGGSAVALFVLVLATALLDALVLPVLAGGSLGKLLVGLRVVRRDGRPAGAGRHLLRWVLLLVDGLPGPVPLLGPLVVVLRHDRRRVGDLAAGTFVVRLRDVGRPVDAAPAAASLPFPPPSSPSSSSPSPPPAAVPTGGVAPPPDAASGQPVWDGARGAWVRWDGDRWTRHDRASGEWLAL